MEKEKFFPGTNPGLVKKKVIVEEGRDCYGKIKKLRSVGRVDKKKI